MFDYSRTLGDIVKVSREHAGLTQAQLAAMIYKDTRTILNIENYKGNPKLEVLFPLVRALRIDSREIFFPERKLDLPMLRQFHLLVDSCTEEEAETLISVCDSVLSAIRSKDKINLE